MKKILFFLTFVFIVLIMTACGNSNSIVGTWLYQNDSNTYYTFNKNSTGSYTYAGNARNFTYEDRGTKVIIKYDGDTNSSEFDYSISDGILTIKDSSNNDIIYKRK